MTFAKLPDREIQILRNRYGGNRLDSDASLFQIAEEQLSVYAVVVNNACIEIVGLEELECPSWGSGPE